ncbi:MAG TPA: nidogen-like domain-containing protein [Coriobacteriia bacterium]|nr:nidogen-like domain-containing protein [Coriobacteriia bacterium]
MQDSKGEIVIQRGGHDIAGVRDTVGVDRRCAGRRDLRVLRTLAIGLVVAVSIAAAGPSRALAAGPDAILTPTGYADNVIARGDDTSNLVVNMPFSMNWNGTNYSQIYINMNGNCTFGSGFTGYNPTTTLAGTNRSIMAPFWADVDTRNAGSAQVTYSRTTAGSTPQVDGRNAFFVNWIGVAAYDNQSFPTNSFQLVIVDRSDTGAGNFDFMFNYDEVTWDIATNASSLRARAGWGGGGAGYELPGSGATQAGVSTLLDDSDPATSLVQNSVDPGGQLGRYVWQVRSGTPNIAPQIEVVDRVLEGNAPHSHSGYSATGDATATDVDGTVVTLTNDRPALLPLGLTDVTWTAVDDRGAVATAHQSILVEDTTAPTAPVIASSTHAVGLWSAEHTVSVQANGSSDLCAGVEGCSYEWSRGSAGVPDTLYDDSSVTPVTTTTTTTVGTQTFSNGTWPADWTRSSATYVRLTQATGRNHGTYAAEIWANNASRRTASFYSDFDLTGFSSANVSLWNNLSAFSTAADYARVEYSVNGGMSWAQLANWVGPMAASGWQQRSYSLPAGGVVRVRISGSVNNSNEFSDWDDVSVCGFTTATTTTFAMAETSAFDDGRWYFNVRSADEADNWSETTSFGPIMIDTTPPVTTDDCPAGWIRTPMEIALAATDAGDLASTAYSLNSGPWVPYLGPIPVAEEGTSTLQYRSADAAGHLESIKTAFVRVDTQAPSVPASVAANPISTSAFEVSWGASSDAVSGLAHYAVYRDGAFVATSSATTYVDEGLNPGNSYSYEVSAIDVAGNESPSGVAPPEPLPASELWIALTPTAVDMGGADPGGSVLVADAARVTVGGVGNVHYELTCTAQDFTNLDTGAPMTTLPAAALSFEGRGHAATPMRPFSTTPSAVGAASGSRYRWSHQYVFDYQFAAPWAFEAGAYTTTVVYTAVPN